MPGAEEEPRRPELDLARARQAALAALTAYRSPDDPRVLLSVLNELSEEVPAHWLLTGLLSVANQLLDYLARSQQVDSGDVLRAIAALEAEASEGLGEPSQGTGEGEPGDGEPSGGELGGP